MQLLPCIRAARLDCFGASAPKKKQMSKALIESSFFRASYAERLDCRGARAPRNDGERSALSSPRHCERSAAIQEPPNERVFHQGGRPKADAKLAMRNALRFACGSGVAAWNWHD